MTFIPNPEQTLLFKERKGARDRETARVEASDPTKEALEKAFTAFVQARGKAAGSAWAMAKAGFKGGRSRGGGARRKHAYAETFFKAVAAE